MTHSSSAAPFPPLRPRPAIGLGRLWVGDEERANVASVLARQTLNRFAVPDGQSFAGQLEAELASLIGAKHALAVTSGTAALEVALGALGIGPGDEVLVPAWSWIACFTSVVRVGARPVLVEVDRSLCFDPAEIARKATARTKAAIVIHFQGVAAHMDALMAEAERANIAVIEDCAQSPGAIYHGRRVGTIGRIGTFSFQNQKTITSGEGGAVVTNDPHLFERAVRMHDLGLFRPVFEVRTAAHEKSFCGGQYRMSELTAAVALAQLRKLDRVRAHCRRLQQIFVERLGTLDGVELRAVHDPSGDSGIEPYLFLGPRFERDAFRVELEERNVNCTAMTRTYCHYSQPYCAEGLAHARAASPFAALGPMPAAGYRAADFPETEKLSRQLIALPFGVAYDSDDARYMADVVRAVHGRFVEREPSR